MQLEENIDVIEYLYAVWRRKWLFVIISLATLMIALFIISKLPVVYRSTGTILIERQEIPERWVNSTVTSVAEERIQSIWQRVLTTENLVRVIERYNLFLNQPGLTLEEKISNARESFSIENVDISATGSRSMGRNATTGTTAFKVSYDNTFAKKAYDVTTDLVNLYLDENRKTRTLAASDTRRFLEVEADRIESQLRGIEKEISKFKEKNMGILPEQQDLNIQAFSRVEQEIGDINATLVSLEERQIVLQSSIATARRVLNTSSVEDVGVQDPARQRLGELQTEYVSLQTRYSSSHPDLKRLQREIGELESQLASGLASGMQSSRGQSIATTIQDDAAIIQLTSDLKSAISERKAQQSRKAELIEKLDEIEVRINKTPEVELEYRSLIRNHQNVQEKYNDIRSKQNSARVSESLEEEQKGERFTLIEEPRLAAYPYSPKYKKLYVMALGLAFIGGLGAVFGLEFLDGTIRNVRLVEFLADAPVLATVGYLENPQDRRRKSVKKIIVISISTLMVLGILYLVKTYQMQTVEQQTMIKKTIKSLVFKFDLPK